MSVEGSHEDEQVAALRNALRLAERRLADTQQLARTGSWERDLIEDVLWWSDETYRLFEIDPARFEPTPEIFDSRIHPDDREAVTRTYRESIARKSLYDIVHRLLMPDGRIKYVREIGRTVYDEHGAAILSIGSVQDVTDQVRADEQLRRSQELLRQVVEVSRVGIFEHDHTSETIYWSPRQREIYGYDPERPATLADFVALVHPEDRDWIMGSIRQAHDPGSDGKWSVEHRVVWPDGSVRWLLSRAQTLFEGQGAARRPLRTIGAVIDVTDIHTVDEAIRLRDHAIATSLTGVAITDAQSIIVYVNPAFLRAWGFESEDQILGRRPADLGAPESIAMALQQVIEHGSFQGELVAQRNDGTPFDIFLSAHAVYDRQGRMTSMMGSFLDLSESKKLEAQLLQAQKMETIGRLAGGVAHDFNNLLTVIQGYTELALGELDPRDQLYDTLTQINAAADSAASLTEQLLAFSRKQIINPQVLDMNEVTGRVERMLARLIGEDIELRVFLEPGAGNIRFDRGQYEQILINLAVNARDAMPHGGTLTIETTTVMLDEAYARLHHDVQPGEYIQLAVSDTGVGMTPDVREHLFEPFFTTKGQGRGTGLGLSMVFGAVAQNGGRIEVYSELDYGTTFKIYLPRIREAARYEHVPFSAARATGQETIVVVEDDDAVRAFATSVLTRIGYQVYAYRTGSAALAAIDSIAEPVHMLLSDVVLSDTNGIALAEQMLERRPDLGVLFVSGYTDNVIVHHGVLKPGIEFLSKPYTIESLAGRVREVLNRRGSAEQE